MTMFSSRTRFLRLGFAAITFNQERSGRRAVKVCRQGLRAVDAAIFTQSFDRLLHRRQVPDRRFSKFPVPAAAHLLDRPLSASKGGREPAGVRDEGSGIRFVSRDEVARRRV